jgi:hypothetical protein
VGLTIHAERIIAAPTFVAADGVLGRKAIFNELPRIDERVVGIRKEHIRFLPDVSRGRPFNLRQTHAPVAI